MTPQLIRNTITRALADTMVDESRRSPIEGRPSRDLSQLPDVGDVVGSQYRLVRLLGKGMFGKVYVAQRLDVPEHQVALKIMPQEVYSGRNVDRELVMLAAAGHPNIVQLKDHGTTDAYVWLTMPVYEGETLASRLERGTLSLREAYDIFVPIARAIEALHSAGLRHQDLKPENIFLAMFAGRLHPIILDLGVAAEKNAPFVAGTILYAAPEQVAALTIGASPLLSEKMDTYGLSATLLRSLAGPELYPGSDSHDSDAFARTHEERAACALRPNALPELQGQPRALLNKAFAKWFAIEPDQRSTTGEMADELDVLLAHERELARLEKHRLTRQKINLQRARVAAGALLLVGIAVAAFAYSQRETLRLANELQQARAQQAESFDKLETCAASHSLAQHSAVTCRTTLEQTRTEFDKTLTDMRATGTSAQAEYASQVMVFTAKLKTVEDTLVAEKLAWETEKLALAEASKVREQQLTEERDKVNKSLDAQSAETDGAREQLASCRNQLASCGTVATDNPYADLGPSAPPRPPPAASRTAPTPPTPPAPAPIPPAEPTPEQP